MALLHYQAKGRWEKEKAKVEKKGIVFTKQFTITIADVKKMYEDQKGHCIVTGLPFRPAKSKAYRTRPFGASVDRIDSKKGYTPDNIRLVVWAVNQAISNFGLPLFMFIADAAAKYGEREIFLGEVLIEDRMRDLSDDQPTIVPDPVYTQEEEAANKELRAKLAAYFRSKGRRILYDLSNGEAEHSDDANQEKGDDRS